MDTNIKISYEMMQEFDKLLLIISELGDAMKQLEYSFKLLNGDTLKEKDVECDILYIGKAKEEMNAFYLRCSNHTQTLINLYSKAYQFAVNAIIDMIEQDMILARALQRGDAKW